MRNIRILILLATIFTIGSVYATWNYAVSKTQNVSASSAVALTQKIENTPMGTIEVDMSGVEIFIDDLNNDYEPELVVDGSIDVTFTANRFAPIEVQENGLALEYTISVTTPWEFKGTQIFTITDDSFAVNNGNPTFSATISATELMDVIILGNIELPTIEDYDAFAIALTEGEIVITVREAK